MSEAKTYTHTIEAPFKRFQDRNVHNQLEAIKLIYDADMSTSDKGDVFIIFQHTVGP